MKPCCVCKLWKNISTKIEHIFISQRKKSLSFSDLSYSPSIHSSQLNCLNYQQNFMAIWSFQLFLCEQGELAQWFSWVKRPSIGPHCCCVWSNLTSNAEYYPLSTLPYEQASSLNHLLHQFQSIGSELLSANISLTE